MSAEQNDGGCAAFALEGEEAKNGVAVHPTELFTERCQTQEGKGQVEMSEESSWIEDIGTITRAFRYKVLTACFKRAGNKFSLDRPASETEDGYARKKDIADKYFERYKEKHQI